jgi:hypothetical protein
MRIAIVTCRHKGIVIAKYKFPFPETLDDSRVARPETQGLIDLAKAKLLSDRLTTPAQWAEIEFAVGYES